MSTIQLRTSIPGPRSQALMKRRDSAVVQGAFHATPVFVAKAEGAVVEDVDGNRLIDFAGGIGCLNTGHRAPAVVEAIRRQLGSVFAHQLQRAALRKLYSGLRKTECAGTGRSAQRRPYW